MGDAFLKLKLRDQAKSMELLAADPQLSKLRQLKVSSQHAGRRLWGPPACLRLYLRVRT